MIKLLFLCKHTGFFAKVIRLITRSSYDHICLRDKSVDLFHDFNYPDGYREGSASSMPWKHKVFVAQVEVDEMEFERLKNSKYNIWFNLNWLTYKLFGLALVRNGDNCVSFVAKSMGITNKRFWCMSPKDFASLVQKKLL